MKLHKIDTLLFMDTGSPSPIILSNEHKVNVLYYYYKDIADLKPVETPKERNIKEDAGIAIITFNNMLSYKSGYPNDEIIESHPYYPLGLASYGMFELEGSDWIAEIVRMNSIHPLTNPEAFKSAKHFIITFKDSTFECIAKSIKIDFAQASMNETLVALSRTFI